MRSNFPPCWQGKPVILVSTCTHAITLSGSKPGMLIFDDTVVMHGDVPYRYYVGNPWPAEDKECKDSVFDGTWMSQLTEAIQGCTYAS